jgi:chlorobactene glucosyltransferase
MPELQSIVLTAYVLAGACCWAVLGFCMLSGRRRMRLRIGPGFEAAAKNLGRVTVLVPAKDEEERIGLCVGSLLAQDHPNLDIVAVNDRSTDRTGEILDAIAQADERRRLKVVHIPAGGLPPGWTGKNHALHVARSHAAGDWLAFVDADVVLRPGAVRVATALAADKKYDMASFVPAPETHSWWEGLIIPACATFVMGMYAAPLTNHDHHRDIAVANGQFMLWRRRVYDAIGGHTAIAGQCCDDVLLVRRAKREGHRVRLLDGTTLASVRMFSSLGDTLRGWGRIFYVISPLSPWRILAACLFLFASCLSVYAALAFGLWRLLGPDTASGTLWAAMWFAAAALHLALMTFFLGLVYHWSGNPWHNALLFPVSALAILRVFWIAAGHYARGTVNWRGTTYRLPRPREVSPSSFPAQPRHGAA